MTRARAWVRFVGALGVVVALAVAPAGAAERGPTPTPKDPRPVDELIVKFKPGVAEVERERVLAEAGGFAARKLRKHAARVAKFNPAALSQALKKLRSDPRVEYAEPNYWVYATAAITPNDPSFGQLWGLKNTGQTVNGVTGTADADIDADEAWSVTTGSSSVVVGVIDTGVDFSHPDLGGSATSSPLMWKNAGETGSGKETNGVDDDVNGYVDDWRGWDFVNNDNNPFDDESHGTHVSGTIGARGNNGIGITGVNWNVKIMALKFLGATGSGSTADAVEAIEYATAMGAHATNNSWGGGGYSQALLEAIRDADTGGSLFVAAAGNAGTDNDAVPDYPAAFDVPNLIAVAASTQNDGRASFSNIGRRSVDLAAPGTNIYSTVPGGGYDWWNGTSMATPHVAGAAGLAKAAFPAASDVGIKALLLESVDATAAFTNLTATGGRLNVARAVSCSSTPMLWVEEPTAGFKASVGEAMKIAAISTMCADAVGATATADVNGASVVLTNRGDGLYSGTYVPTAAGSLTVTVTASGGSQTKTRTVTGSAVENYRFLDDGYAWIDATAGGTRLTPFGDDSAATVTLPFSFSYYRQAFTSLKVSSNGYLVFGASPATDPYNAPIPTSYSPNGVVAPYWDDLHPGRSGAAVWYRTVGTSPNRKFVVAWINVPHFSGIGDRITFEAILEEATGDVVFQYADSSFGNVGLDHGATATVGVENLDGMVGRQFSFDEARLQPYQATKSLRATMRDTTPPETTIDSGPSGTTSSTNATFTFSSSEAGSTFQCQLDGGTWSACSSPVSHSSLSSATHTFRARATDPAGNVDPTPAERTWTIDATPPETTIDSGPSGTTASTDATFTFSSSEAGSSFQCQLDGGAWSACSSPKSYTALSVATHTFQVRAVDAVGNADPTPAGRTWAVEDPLGETTVNPQGSWLGSYGADGYALTGWDGTSDLAALPNATLVLEQGNRYLWQPTTTTQVRALQSPDGSYRRSATVYHSSEVRLRLDFVSAYSGTLHLYALDWDSIVRRQRLTVTDSAGARTIELAAPFDQGIWVHAPISVAAGGTVAIRATRTAGANAVLSGLFLGGP